MAATLPATVPQLHSSQYRNPRQIASRHVLVVGSGSSGVQICEDLAKSNRFDSLTLAVSGNLVVPLKVLGVPTYTIMRWLRLPDLRTNSWLGRQLTRDLTGKGDPTIPLSPDTLAQEYGVALVGKATAVQGDHIRCLDGQTVSLDDLTVLWCTGFCARYDFIQPTCPQGVLDGDSLPIHQRGVVTAAPGLYFVGLRFQYTVTSQDIYGVGRDARYVERHVAERLRAERQTDGAILGKR